MIGSVYIFSLIFLIMCVFNLSVKLDVSGEVAREQAEYALSELSKLSDSGVYSTLKLHTILAASEEEGIFHHNTMLTLKLSSPYFLSGSTTENFDIVVMRHKDDDIRSIAIDEFPVMTEAAIEEFWIHKVEDQRAQRETAFRKLELSAVIKQQQHSVDIIDTSTENGVQSVEQIQAMLQHTDSATQVAARKKKSLDIQQYLIEPYKSQEEALMRLTLAQLYAVSISARGGANSDFERERARQILDEHILRAGDL